MERLGREFGLKNKLKYFEMGNPIETLRKYWGYESFRGIQSDIINSILAGRDTVGLMPTGGGKSICFQVPALCMDGVCVVVTPLIALMKDQVAHLKANGILATCIHSGLTRAEVLRELDNCILGHNKFLYLSPERLETQIFIEKLKRIKVSFIAIDEAHCISQWGYDFRPSYLRLKELRKLLPDTPVLALTATATLTVLDDIQQQLAFKEKNVFRMSFERKNLAYIVENVPNKYEELIKLLHENEGSAIVYTRNRAGTRETAEWLRDQGFSAHYYHAGLTNLDKDMKQQQWTSGAVRIMVCTNAFGMGIDKPDVRLVVHLEMPDSIEAYFQEAGRAGRDGKPAKCVLLHQKNDDSQMLRRVSQEFPPREFIWQIYNEIAYFLQVAAYDGEGRRYEFNLGRFCKNFRHFPLPVVSALKILTRAGYIDYTDEDDNHSRLMMLLQRDELYHLNSLSYAEDKVMQAVLRLYSGLFSEYVTVDESDIAEIAGYSREEVYETLKSLTRQRILNYVPAKDIPHITYVRARVPEEEIAVSASVLEDRMANYEARLKAIVEYANQTDVCRSRYLLRYFADPAADKVENCGKCDLCR